MGGLFGGCAAITEGTSQDLLVGTTPVSGASCQIQNEKGSWSVASTPATVSISKARGALNVSCKHPQGGEGSAMVESSLAAMTFGNALIGGLIGVTIDTTTGAAFFYPETVTVALTGAPPAPPADAAPAQSAPAMTSEEAEQRLKELDAAAAAPRPAKPGAPSSNGDSIVEIAFWNSVKDSEDPALYEAYLQQYPGGNFAAIARIKFKQLATGTGGGGVRQAALQKASPAPGTPATLVRFGDTVEFACPKPGTIVELSDGDTLVFVNTQGALCSYTTRPGGQPATVSLLGSFGEEAPKLQQLWPLAVGKNVSFTYVGGPNSSRQVELKVTRHEPVTVEAGTFDTFVIEARIWSPGQSFIGAFGETVTYWFAPAVGYPVKVAHHLENGVYGTGSDHEAVKVATVQ